MTNADLLDTTNIARGWQFINLFHDVRASLYYCRLRQQASGRIASTDYHEISAAGATMQFAFDNANLLAKQQTAPSVS